MKVKCNKCGELKREDEFHWRVKWESRRKDCKACDKKRLRKYRKPEPTTKEKEAAIQAAQSAESKLFNPLITRKW